jgi:lactoylglutathione lyase
MEKLKAVIKNAWPYQKDKMNLPVENVLTAVPFYQTVMGFKLVRQTEEPVLSVVLERDGIEIGISQNGGDPAQDGCFFEVDNVETAAVELRSNGLEKDISGFDIQQHGDIKWKVFFIVAPDGLCYCLGERQA